MDIHDYLGVLRRGWTLVVLGVLIGVAGGAAGQYFEQPSYAATSRNLVTSTTSGDISASVQANGLAAGRVASYVLVASSGLVLQPVIDELNLDTSVSDLARQITVTAPTNTLVIEITATAATPALARDIANVTSRVFSEVVAEQIDPAPAAVPTPTPTVNPDGTITTPLPKVTVTLSVVNIEQAELPTSPETPIGQFFLVIGGVFGLGLGLVLASLREALDRRIRTKKDVAAVTTAPVVGQIRADRSVRNRPLVVSEAPDSAMAESFRALRTNLDHLRLRDGQRSYVVTGMGRGSGTTTIVANLAQAVAKTGGTVVVVDANLRSPDLSSMLGRRGARGLTDLLAGEIPLEEALRQGAGGVWLLPIGTRQPSTGELLATPAMRHLLADLRSRFDVVLVDAPAISAATDATVLGGFDNGTILVVPVGIATRPRLAEMLASLELGGSTPAGIVLNRIPRLQRGRRAADQGLQLVRPGVEKAAKAPKPARVKVAKAPKAPKAPKGAVVEPKTVLDQPPSRFAPSPAVYSAPRPGVTAATGIPPIAPPTAPVTVIPVVPPRVEAPAPVVEPVAVAPHIEEQHPEPARITVQGYSNVTSITPALSRERQARESYAQKSRELERAALERLAYEQQLIERRVREQLLVERRELGSALEEYLEETVIIHPTAAEK